MNWQIKVNLILHSSEEIPRILNLIQISLGAHAKIYHSLNVTPQTHLHPSFLEKANNDSCRMIEFDNKKVWEWHNVNSKTTQHATII